jgi:hypothetical protein
MTPEEEITALKARVRELERALRRAKPLVRLVTVKQIIDAGEDAINAAGLDPWCLNEGTANGSERIDACFIHAALTQGEKGGEL